jgi:predicted nucleotidyltransferase
MLQPFIYNKLTDIGRLCKKHNVSHLYAFGSVCTDRFNEQSDVDLLVSFHGERIPAEDYADNYLDMIDEFEELLGKTVDLVSENALKNRYFISTIAKTKTALYEG